MSDLPDLAKILEQLAAAQTPAELRELHGRLGFAIKAKRKVQQKAYGPLARAYMTAIQVWDADKVTGVPLAERQAHLEQVLRAAWPQTREWHYLCETCRDTGWETCRCTPTTHCGRRVCEPGHDYVQPCGICPKGEGRRAQLEPKTPTPGDFQQAGKRKKGFTRLGR
jgi:hypothetical protein